MTLEREERLPIEKLAEPAANQDSLGIVTLPLEAPRPEAGWSPFEVWRTRVRNPASLLGPRYERDRSR